MINRIKIIASLLLLVVLAGCSHNSNNLLSSQSPTPEICPLAVYLDLSNIRANDPVPSTPVSITGWVNKPDAQVTVRGKAAPVNIEGYFSADVLLIEGNNIIQAIATLNDKTDSIAETVLVENGIITFPPGQGIQYVSILRMENIVAMERGDKATVDVTLETRKDFRDKVEINYLIYPVANEYSEDEITIAKGMEITIDPSSFIACPNSTYHSTIKLTTTNSVSPGDYWFRLEKTGSTKTISWLDVRVR